MNTGTRLDEKTLDLDAASAVELDRQIVVHDPVDVESTLSPVPDLAGGRGRCHSTRRELLQQPLSPGEVGL